MADESQYSMNRDTTTTTPISLKRRYGNDRPTGFSEAPDAAAPPSSFNSVPPPNNTVPGIKLATQHAQGVAARLLRRAPPLDPKRPKRPKLDNGSLDSIDVKSHYSAPPISPSAVSCAHQGGSGGASKKIDIKDLQLQSGAKIQVTRDIDADPNTATRMVELMGTPDAIAEAEAGGSGIVARRVAGQVGSDPQSRAFYTKEKDLELQVFDKEPLIDYNRVSLGPRRPDMATRGRGRGRGKSSRPIRISTNMSNTSSKKEMIETFTPTRQINIGDQTIFDFTGSEHCFNLGKGACVTEKEKILIDNIFIAHKKRDFKHQIACLNALTHLFSQNGKYYVVYTGKTPGIYKEWAEVVPLIKKGKHKYHKFQNFQEAMVAAETKIAEEMYVSPKLIHHYEAKTQNIEKDQKILVLEETVAHLQSELRKAQKSKGLEGASYAKAVNDENHTETDKLLEEIKKVRADTKSLNDSMKELHVCFADHDKRPSEPYAKFLEELIKVTVGNLLVEEEEEEEEEEMDEECMIKKEKCSSRM